jgi:hypothetical protein
MHRMSTQSKSRNIEHKRSQERHTARSSSKVRLIFGEWLLLTYIKLLVLGVKGMHLPLPEQPTALTCTLNNGIHFVSTPECPLGRDSRIEQEFEL